MAFEFRSDSAKSRSKDRKPARNRRKSSEKVPRISKTLPARRADYSFGDLVYWHLFVYGSRPTGDPSAKMGRVWEPDAICELLGISGRTLRNWIADRHLPDSVIPLERELFGDNPLFDDWRLELAEALRRSRAGRKGRKSRFARWLTGEPAADPFPFARFPACRRPAARPLTRIPEKPGKARPRPRVASRKSP